MAQLKASFIKEIHDAISSSCFSLQDFIIEFPETGALIKIVFKYNDNFSLVFKENTRTQSVSSGNTFHPTPTERITSRIDVIAIPGNYKSRELWHLDDLHNIPNKIPSWCECVREELYAHSPRKDPLEELRNRFAVQWDELIDNPDDNFTIDEIMSIEGKFDNLYKKFTELKDEYEISKEQLSHIQKEFEEFKKSAHAYQKGTWSKITINKLVDIVSNILKSKEGREFILGEVKKLFSGS